MYVPSEPEDEFVRGAPEAMPWQGTSPAPVRWAGPNLPVGPGATLNAPPPQYPPVPLPIRAAAPPTRSGALLSLGSFVVSVALYAGLLGLRYGLGVKVFLLALGITVLLLVHELGHYVVIRAKGLPASLPVFIPLLGAYVAMRRLPDSVRDDAVIALAGPLAGCFSSLGCLALYETTGVALFLPLAFLGYALNVLNLVPILPLDGGRVANAISPWISPLAFALIIWYAISSNNFVLLILIAFFGLPALVRAFSIGRRAAFFRISFITRVYLAVVYLVLTAALFFGLLATPVPLGFGL